MRPGNIVVIGNANVDLTTYLDRAPDNGETVLGNDFTIGMGGKGANQAVAASRAGGNVAFIGRVGDDAFGDMVLDALTQEGLNLESLLRVPGKSGVASIYVDQDGGNRIAVYTGASATLNPTAARQGIAGHTPVEILISQLEINQETVLAALEAATTQGATTILNTAPYAPLIPGVLQNTTWLIANEVEITGVMESVGGEMSEITDNPETLAQLLPDWSEALGCNLIVTLGAAGALGYATGEKPFSYQPEPVVALDTVGAGDCFVGYFAALLHEGLPWQQALAGGVMASSDSVQRAGAQSSYPLASTATSFLDRAQSVAL
jgi:ribokinase